MHRNKRDTKYKSKKNTEDKTLKKIVGIHNGRDAILAERWSHKRCVIAKSVLWQKVVRGALPPPPVISALPDDAYLNCPVQSTPYNGYYFIFNPLFREYLLGIIQISK